MTSDPLRVALEKILKLGHNDDCLFCGFKDKVARAALARPAGGVETVRYGYEYSLANDAYEIAPIGIDGELDWDNEVCITASGDEAVAKLIVDVLNAPRPALESDIQNPHDPAKRPAEREE